MTLLVRSISTPYRRALVNEFPRLDITWTFHAGTGTALALWSCLITLISISILDRQQSIAVAWKLTLTCLFLHRSHALLDGTPGILPRYTRPIKTMTLKLWRGIATAGGNHTYHHSILTCQLCSSLSVYRLRESSPEQRREGV